MQLPILILKKYIFFCCWAVPSVGMSAIRKEMETKVSTNEFSVDIYVIMTNETTEIYVAEKVVNWTFSAFHLCSPKN